MTISSGKRASRLGVFSKKKTPIALATLTAALVVTGASFALGNTGVTSTNIQPAPGLPTNGAVASTDTGIATGITRTQGNAQLQSGVTLARIETAPSYANKLRVSVFWTDPYDGGKALNNPNAQISVGIYDPIHTGTCVNTSSSEVANYVTVTDGTGNTYCSRLDTSATGSASVSSVGKLMISEKIPGGYLLPSTADNGSPVACNSFSGTKSQETALSWCEPTTTAAGSLTTSGPGVMYVVASILTPGGSPKGQQATINSLSFFINALSG